MNERVLELAKEADPDNWHKRWYSGINPRVMDPEIKKFVELIIAKCIEEAGDPADGLIKGNTWHDGVRASVWSIKQYFGVEE